MKRRMRGTIVLLSLAAAGQAAMAHEHPTPPAPAAFEELKALVGTWEGTAPNGAFTIAFRTSASGSVLIETMFPGTEHEMVNVYHPDGQNVRMTHYCAGGNQPHLRLDSSSHSSKNGTKWHFVADSVSNLARPDAGYMNDVVLSLKDKDHLVAAWGTIEKGQTFKPMTFTMTRKK